MEWGETDAAGIVFYPNYYRWFDQASHDLFRQLGCPMTELMAGGIALPMVEAKARFLTPLRYGDEAEIISCVDEIRTRALRVHHVVSRGGQKVCEGYEVRMWVRLEPGGRLIPEVIPDEIRSVLTPHR